jgi:hypothetical protein
LRFGAWRRKLIPDSRFPIPDSRFRMPAIDDFIIITEVDPGPAFAAPIFRRKYRDEPPDVPHHFVAFWKRGDESFVPVSYLHFTDCDDLILIGGACTDGEKLRAMGTAERAAIDAAGGINLAVTRYAIERYARSREAIFGLCGDERSFHNLAQCGFERVREPHLIARWSWPPTAQRRIELITKAESLAPF